MKLLLLIMIALVLSNCRPILNTYGGPQGIPGTPGINGHSALIRQDEAAENLCFNGGTVLNTGVDLNNNGLLELEEVMQTSVVCSGSNGSNGSPTPFTPTAIINPCGNAPGIYDEIFLKLANGMLIASFSDNANGKNTRFSVLYAGSYYTTDGDNCSFKVDANGNIYDESKQY